MRDPCGVQTWPAIGIQSADCAADASAIVMIGQIIGNEVLVHRNLPIRVLGTRGLDVT